MLLPCQTHIGDHDVPLDRHKFPLRALRDRGPCLRGTLLVLFAGHEALYRLLLLNEALLSLPVGAQSRYRLLRMVAGFLVDERVQVVCQPSLDTLGHCKELRRDSSYLVFLECLRFRLLLENWLVVFRLTRLRPCQVIRGCSGLGLLFNWLGRCLHTLVLQLILIELRHIVLKYLDLI